SASSIAGPAVILSWLVGGILVMFIALNYAEVSGMLPRTGAIVRYPHFTHGSYTGYILGWTYMLSAVTVPTIEAEAVVGYIASYYPAKLPPISTTVTNILSTSPGHAVTVLTPFGIALSFLLIVFFFVLNYFGIRFLGKFNKYATYWKILIPGLTFILLLLAFHASNFTLYHGFAPEGYANVFLAIPTAGIVFSYLGFRQALEYGGEAKRPQHDVPRATIYSVLIGIVLYTVLQIAFTGAINWADIKLVNSSGVATGPITPGDWGALVSSTWASGPFYNALTASGIGALGAFALVLLIDAYISPSGTGWIYMGTGTRTFYGLSADGYFPKFFQRLHEKYRIPWIALIASLVVGVIFLLPFPSWYLLVGFISSATVFTYMMGGIALKVFRRTAPSLKRPYRLPASAILAPIGFLAAALIVYWSGIELVTILAFAIFAGIPVYMMLYAPKRFGFRRSRMFPAGVIFWAVLLALFYYAYAFVLVPGQKETTTGVPLSSSLVTSFAILMVLLAVLILGGTYLMGRVAPSDRRKELYSAYWLLVFTLGIMPISFFGAFGYDTLVAFPYDNIVAIVFGLIMFYVAVNSGYQTEDVTAILSTEGVPIVPEAAGASEE
ncbi:MAG: amino acid permease, partial [Methanomassiliicoccales archaeon]